MDIDSLFPFGTTCRNDQVWLISKTQLVHIDASGQVSARKITISGDFSDVAAFCPDNGLLAFSHWNDNRRQISWLTVH